MKVPPFKFILADIIKMCMNMHIHVYRYMKLEEMQTTF